MTTELHLIGTTTSTTNQNSLCLWYNTPWLCCDGLAVNPDFRVWIDVFDDLGLLDESLHARHGRIIHPYVLLVGP